MKVRTNAQVQYGGVGNNKIDYDGAPYVAVTFKKAFKEKLEEVEDLDIQAIERIFDTYNIRLEDEELMEAFPRAYKFALRSTTKKTFQGAESLYHNLNTLESRAGSQVPFTSINFGTDTSPEGRLISEALLLASIAGIGEHKQTSIFPISIFKHRKGVNDKPGTPNYDLKQLAIKSLSKRIYPNIVNVDAPHLPIPTNPNEEHATMGCRTMVGADRHGINGMGGRGNIAPATMNLVDIGIRNGICLGKRDRADIEGFWKDLDKLIDLCEEALVDRFNWIATQPSKSGFFMHENKTMKNLLNRQLESNETVREAMKHNTLAMGYIGVAEAMVAMFGKHHGQDEEVYDFAYKVVERIHNRAKEASDKHDLNFSCYASPAESTCHTLVKILKDTYGLIPGVTDREFITNSHHIPVYHEISIYDKINKEAPFAKLATGGYICYVELDSSVMDNPEAIESIINYAMEQGISYLAINFPIDTCLDCGYSSEITEDNCPICSSDKVQRLRRVTGYLTSDYRRFNKGKQFEVQDRVKHSRFVAKI